MIIAEPQQIRNEPQATRRADQIGMNCSAETVPCQITGEILDDGDSREGTDLFNVCGDDILALAHEFENDDLSSWFVFGERI